jgi:hypothetical protein
MTYMRSWTSHRLTHINWLGIIHKLGDLSEDCRAIGLFFYDTFHDIL